MQFMEKQSQQKFYIDQLKAGIRICDILDALAFLIKHRIVDRTYPDKTGLPYYAINPDPDSWTVWKDATEV